ncbi:MAG TPA: aldehyde dehydrogenase family protein, partial [Rhizobium sp.]|nr:aldehyde dehydrogenase family protein [Rhizobium sp.]
MKTTVSSIEGSRQGLFINGEFVAPKAGNYIASYDPTTGERWYDLAEADADDASAAVAAANAAFRNPAWRRMTQTDRGALVRKLAELVRANADRLAEIETRDNGKLLKETRAQMRSMPDSYHYFAGMADKLQGDTIPINRADTLNINLREALGVVGMITPWNSPLMLLTGTLAPCLAIGNTVVIKPSEHATASTLALAELIHEAGFPAGVVNVVTGTGKSAG